MNTILEFGDAAGPETKALIENVVEEACGDLEKLVASWFFMPGHSLKFGPAEDDDGTPNPEIFCVEFIKDRKTLCISRLQLPRIY